MATGIINIIKQASLDAMDNAQICDIRTGEVISTSPLKIKVTNLFTIPSSMLIVPRHLTDHEVEVTVDWNTSSSGSHNHSYSGTSDTTSGGSGESSFASHSHGYNGNTSTEGTHAHDVAGRKTMIIHNALKVGDEVALLRKQGGQSYFILDRI